MKVGVIVNHFWKTRLIKVGFITTFRSDKSRAQGEGRLFLMLPHLNRTHIFQTAWPDRVGNNKTKNTLFFTRSQYRKTAGNNWPDINLARNSVIKSNTRHNIVSSSIIRCERCVGRATSQRHLLTWQPKAQYEVPESTRWRALVLRLMKWISGWWWYRVGSGPWLPVFSIASSQSIAKGQ